MKLKTLLLATTFVLPPMAAIAEDTHHKSGAAVAQANANAALTDGEIRKVDKDAKKITIKHGPIQSLDMPAMTMVFQVKDPGLLEQVKAGDKVKFATEKLGGAFAVTWIEKVN
ncbi:MAG: copper-binding protein [Betaproteobacteria bacterium]|nr:copper-binding protein [Betaproteobacteria bacterium]MSQ88369.1 copper-binding protein [Betaproteobacteria bacterium]